MKPLAPGITLRPMTLADVDAVHALDERCFSLPWPKRSYIFEIRENQAAHNWVAEVKTGDEPHIVGMMVCWLLVEDIHIATVGVDQAYRRQGIASALLRLCFRELAPLGAQRATRQYRRRPGDGPPLRLRGGRPAPGLLFRHPRGRHLDDPAEPGCLAGARTARTGRRAIVEPNRFCAIQ